LNPRNLSVHSISSRARSTTLPPLQGERNIIVTKLLSQKLKVKRKKTKKSQTKGEKFKRAIAARFESKQFAALKFEDDKVFFLRRFENPLRPKLEKFEQQRRFASRQVRNYANARWFV
jgi:hypothetical protein